MLRVTLHKKDPYNIGVIFYKQYPSTNPSLANLAASLALDTSFT